MTSECGRFIRKERCFAQRRNDAKGMSGEEDPLARGCASCGIIRNRPRFLYIDFVDSDLPCQL